MTSDETLEVNNLFIAAGCNRVVNNISWGASGLVSFGAQNSVAIFCPNRAQILTTLPGHKAFVNCTKWIPSTKDVFKVKDMDKHYLLSGDADGVIIVWEITLTDGKWRRVLQVPEQHKKGVTCISGIMVSQTAAVIASTSSDCNVHIWEMLLPSTSESEFKLSFLESLFLGSKAMVALALVEMPGSVENIILALGGLDNKIHLYCGQRTGKFFHACVLKGHTDWIRCLDFSLPICNAKDDSIFLVSSSQDRSIRLWKMSLIQTSIKEEDIGLASYIKGHIVVVGSSSYQISLESLLIGHEDWVYSVEWQPPTKSSTEANDIVQPHSILSASMDKTMMIWQPEKTTGIWMNVVTVGELSHSALGFYGGHWSTSGDSILAYGYGGSFHLWKNVGVEFDNWQPQIVPSGHFASVTDAAWARSGEYILSVSHDQTTRIFAPWKTEDGFSWHEIARPQVHGHDINCVTMIQGKGNQRFVSGADEKVARVFEAPLSFLKTLDYAHFQRSDMDVCLQDGIQILGANMSALGLSQKPIYVQAVDGPPSKTGNDELETIPDAVPTVLTEAPIEEQLAWHTLWPESHKLYGHGNELFSLCCDFKGELIASSCKAQSATLAEIWLWEVGSWKTVGRLQSHSLTVTQMEFSFDNSLLLAVSRDRHFSVFSIKKIGDEVSSKLLVRQEAHKRIIWGCSWNPCGHEFATGSRDKTVKIWGVARAENEACSVEHLMTLPQFNSSVTALSWSGLHNNSLSHKGLLAVGMENGLIELWYLSAKKTTKSKSRSLDFNATLGIRLDTFICHVSTVHRLAWRTNDNDADCGKTLQLASCGADNCLRVFEVISVDKLG